MEDNTTTIRICVVYENQLRFLSVEPTLENLQALVGGNLEARSLRASTHVYFDEDGLSKGLPPNDLANRLFPLMQSSQILLEGIIHKAPPFPTLVGPVLVIGSQEPNGQPDGDEHNLSRRTVIDLVLGWMERPMIGDKV